MAWKLCSKQDVTSIHPTQESVLQDFWSDAVEELVRVHLGNPYLGYSEVVVDELHDGNDKSLILVDKPPVLSVEAVRVADVPLTAADYRAIPNGIELLYQRFPEGHLNVSFDYTSGSGAVEISPIVRLCAASMIVAILNYRGRAGSDSSIKWGSADTKEGSPSPTFEIGLTDHLVKIMRRLLRRNKLRVR